MEIEKDLGITIPISHETHRGRILYSPFVALRVADAFPSIRFTLDLSHWVVVAERKIDVDLLAPIISRTLHVHARIGTSQAPQVADPRGEGVAEWRGYFEDVWGGLFEAGEVSGPAGIHFHAGGEGFDE